MVAAPKIPAGADIFLVDPLLAIRSHNKPVFE